MAAAAGAGASASDIEGVLINLRTYIEKPWCTASGVLDLRYDTIQNMCGLSLLCSKLSEDDVYQLISCSEAKYGYEKTTSFLKSLSVIQASLETDTVDGLNFDTEKQTLTPVVWPEILKYAINYDYSLDAAVAWFSDWSDCHDDWTVEYKTNAITYAAIAYILTDRSKNQNILSAIADKEISLNYLTLCRMALCTCSRNYLPESGASSDIFNHIYQANDGKLTTLIIEAVSQYLEVPNADMIAILVNFLSWEFDIHQVVGETKVEDRLLDIAASNEKLNRCIRYVLDIRRKGEGHVADSDVLEAILSTRVPAIAAGAAGASGYDAKTRVLFRTAHTRDDSSVSSISDSDSVHDLS